MHIRKTLTVRNPLKPVPERLPCKLTREEKYSRTEHRMAIERTIEELDGEIAEVKSKAKAKVTEINTKRTEHINEMRTLREQILNGTEVRIVDCLLLEDLNEGALYTYRLDTGEVVTRKDIRPEELAELRSRLPLDEKVEKTVDIPDGIEVVKRFDSDPPGVVEEDVDAGELAADGEDTEERPPGYGEESDEHDCTFNEGECVTCGAAEPEEEEPKPVRRKKGEGRAKRVVLEDESTVGTH